MNRYNVSIHVIRTDSDSADDDTETEIEQYIEAETSKAAAIKAIQELVADDDKIHFIHVGRRLPAETV